MKRFFILAAVIAVLAACTKTTVYDDTRNEIGISPVAGQVTKAYFGPVDTYNDGETFGVFAQHTTEDAAESFSGGSGDLSPYLSNVEFIKDASEAGVWHGSTTYYWPKTGSLYFAGYSPFSASGTKDYSFERSTPSLTITNFTQGNYSSSPDKYQMVDLMWFDATSESANSGAPNVVFNHSLSWLTFKIKCSDGLNDLFAIKKVVLENINQTGTFTSNGEKSKAVWNPVSNPQSITLYDDTQTITSTEYIIDNLLIIPQATQNLIITYTQKAAAGTPDIEQTFTTKLDGGDGASGKENWMLGKHYTYTIKFSADKIKLTPSVDAWGSISNDIPIE